MRLAATLVRASNASRILDLGSGFGYSALWLAAAAPEESEVTGIDRFPEHVAKARDFAVQAGLDIRINFIAGDVVDVVDELEGPFDFVHDDTWFAHEPSYLARVVELLRHGAPSRCPTGFCSRMRSPANRATTGPHLRVPTGPRRHVAMQAN
jgi:predicted O-methyltransferase YrrM